MFKATSRNQEIETKKWNRRIKLINLLKYIVYQTTLFAHSDVLQPISYKALHSVGSHRIPTRE